MTPKQLPIRHHGWTIHLKIKGNKATTHITNGEDTADIFQPLPIETAVEIAKRKVDRLNKGE